MITSCYSGYFIYDYNGCTVCRGLFIYDYLLRYNYKQQQRKTKFNKILWITDLN